MVIKIEKTGMKARSLQFEAKCSTEDGFVYSAYGPTKERAEEKVIEHMKESFKELSEFLYPKTSKLGLRISIEDLILKETDFDYNDDEILIEASTINDIISLVRCSLLGENNV